MFRIFIIAEGDKSAEGLSSALMQKGYACFLSNRDESLTEQIAEYTPDLVLVAGDSPARIEELSRQTKRDKNLPIIALVDSTALKMDDSYLDSADDFVTEPVPLNELELRIRRLLKGKNADDSELIKCGDLTIDLAKCEASVGNRPILLTFKEYQLLKFLASSQGRVFTREALLSRVWGYEYFGGDRTVDVHIKRLRSKIEDANHTFIETVRNIGYRLRADL